MDYRSTGFFVRNRCRVDDSCSEYVHHRRRYPLSYATPPEVSFDPARSTIPTLTTFSILPN